MPANTAAPCLAQPLTASTAEAFLKDLFSLAVAASHPAQTLPRYLPKDTTGKALVIGAGKGAAAMAKTFEAHWQGPVRGLVVTRYEHGEHCRHIEVIEAAHPVPDAQGTLAAERTLALIDSAAPDEHIFCLLSGGGSSLLSLPATGISLAQKQAINKALLKCGASIDEINCVRKHLSAIKGGQLALRASPRPITTFAISDVPNDSPDIIASGPTVADPSTREQALNIVKKYAIALPNNLANWLHNPDSETPKTLSHNASYQLIATPIDALNAAAEFALAQGITPLVLGDSIEGEACEVAKVFAGIAKFTAKHNQPLPKPCVILSGGETTVTVKGHGRGGRNAEFLLSLFHELKGQTGIYALAGDTDGIDGTEDNAGALFSPSDYTKAQALALNSADYLANNDGYSFFECLNRLIMTQPTRTNVNDFRAILII
ncbi:glycerate kinase type-2 family protein [Marinagarivorans algicola]|uniref:glycerate kinase type-2 family protein n=1 Tax=Marinagarivorans algicola TaxID=1513270 RepID=UPI00373633B6